MEAFLTGLDSLMQPAVLLSIVIGSVGGLIIGAVPGIGPAIAIAILLPATVFLDDLVSLVLLLGVYGSSMYGGAIPAILINTPGTPVNALTTYDGYAMTRRGEASRALSLAYSASFFGGCFSILMALIALFVFGPYLRDLGALFGQRDILIGRGTGGRFADCGASPDDGHRSAAVRVWFLDRDDRTSINPQDRPIYL